MMSESAKCTGLQGTHTCPGCGPLADLLSVPSLQLCPPPVHGLSAVVFPIQPTNNWKLLLCWLSAFSTECHSMFWEGSISCIFCMAKLCTRQPAKLKQCPLLCPVAASLSFIVVLAAACFTAQQATATAPPCVRFVCFSQMLLNIPTN